MTFMRHGNLCSKVVVKWQSRLAWTFSSQLEHTWQNRYHCAHECTPLLKLLHRNGMDVCSDGGCSWRIKRGAEGSHVYGVPPVDAKAEECREPRNCFWEQFSWKWFRDLQYVYGWWTCDIGLEVDWLTPHEDRSIRTILRILLCWLRKGYLLAKIWELVCFHGSDTRQWQPHSSRTQRGIMVHLGENLD